MAVVLLKKIKMPNKKTKKTPPVSSSVFRRLFLSKKLTALLAIVIVGGIGTYILIFAHAATNNCQAENNVQICDVNMVGGGSDTVLSVNEEAETLSAQGWGLYYGADFRAPTSAYNGAVPVYRVYNSQYTWHDWVTDGQKRDKEAKYAGVSTEGVAFFAWNDGSQPGTVPIYRLTRGGSGSQSIFSADKAWIDKMVADGANNPDGWKSGSVLPAIAFWAFPPNYKVANQANPYDCAILENFTSDRCTAARNSLQTAISSGAIPKDNSCPQTFDAYNKAPFPSQFSADCQKFWNAYAQDCTKQENFTSDRCKGPREALAAAQAEQARQRAAAAAAPTTNKSSSGGSGTKSLGAQASTTRPINVPSQQIINRSQEVRDSLARNCARRDLQIDVLSMTCIPKHSVNNARSTAVASYIDQSYACALPLAPTKAKNKAEAVNLYMQGGNIGRASNCRK